MFKKEGKQASKNVEKKEGKIEDKEVGKKVEKEVDKHVRQQVKSQRDPGNKPDASLVTSHNYFHGHDCRLRPGSLSEHLITSTGIKLWIFNFMAVHAGDIRAINMHRSYAALCAEKYRHHQNYRYIIHPYSKFRFYIECMFVALTVIGSLVLAYHYSALYSYLDENNWREYIMSCCDFMILFNVIANFFTGYVEGYSSKFTVLSIKKIALHYLKTWLIVDLLASSCLLSEFYMQHFTLCLVLESAKIVRIPIIMVYLNNILTVMKATFFEKTIVEVLFCLTIYLSWNIFFQFAVEYGLAGSYKPKNPRPCSWLTVGKLWNQTTGVRLFYAFDRAVGMLTTNTNMNLLEQKRCLENFLIICWIFSTLLIFHYALKYTLAVFGKESASAQYYMMKKQLETYMVQRNFHPRLKSKILKFYAIRFQSKFFEESRMLGCVSGQLREDILMHTGRQLVRELDFLKQLPSSLLVQIAVKLRLVIYIAGDIIFKINTVGDCLYFIDRGTVAIYSDSGKEICHLEDGDYFGEIALVMKNHFRTASVVAVTNCELFRLDREHFETTIAYYPTVYNSIKEVATRRFERTRVLDEHHKAELKTGEVPTAVFDQFEA